MSSAKWRPFRLGLDELDFEKLSLNHTGGNKLSVDRRHQAIPWSDIDKPWRQLIDTQEHISIRNSNISIQHNELCCMQTVGNIIQASLQWRHMNATLQFTGNSNVCWTICSNKTDENVKILHYWLFARGIHQWQMDSLSQRASNTASVLMSLYTNVHVLSRPVLALSRHRHDGVTITPAKVTHSGPLAVCQWAQPATAVTFLRTCWIIPFNSMIHRKKNVPFRK